MFEPGKDAEGRAASSGVLGTAPTIKDPPAGTGAPRRNRPQSLRKFRGGWTTKIHLGAAKDVPAVQFALSPGQVSNAPEGRKLLRRLESQTVKAPLRMDCAYEGRENRQ